MFTIHSSNVYINNMMSYTYMWQTIVTKISVFGTKTMISDRKTMYSAKYKASRVNDMVFHAEIEIFDRNVLQASYKKAKCLVSGTETFFFRMKTPISDWNENLSLSRKLLCDRNFIPTSVNNCYGLF